MNESNLMPKCLAEHHGGKASLIAAFAETRIGPSTHD